MQRERSIGTNVRWINRKCWITFLKFSELAKVSDWIDIDLPLSYEEDWKKINEVLKECCSLIKEEEEIRDCIYKGVQEFADSAILYKIRIFCAPEKKADMRRRALQIIQEELEKENISIPYPQMDIHCKN